MKRNLLIFGSMALMLFPPVLAQNEGWDNLFNGENLKGWEQLNGTAKIIPTFSSKPEKNSYLALCSMN
jgi:hypothetical protein